LKGEGMADDQEEALYESARELVNSIPTVYQILNISPKKLLKEDCLITEISIEGKIGRFDIFMQ